LQNFAAAPAVMAPTRDGFGRGLLALGERDPRVVVLDADLSRSTRTDGWADRFAHRFYNCGIAEQNMIGMAAGLAAAGWIPFAVTYAIFIGRAFDQIRQSVSYGRQNVKIVGCHAGFAASFDGGSHQGLEDLALMRVLPGLTILSPMDATEAAAAVALAATLEGPVYLRLQKEATADFSANEPPLSLERTLQWGGGTDVALIATGSRVHACLQAAAALERENVTCRVLALGVLKPFDREALRQTARQVRLIVTVEEHMAVGGLYEAVCEALTGLACRVEPIAAMDGYGQTGAWDELLAKHQMDVAGVVAVVRRQRAWEVEV
jgi:transketolase